MAETRLSRRFSELRSRGEAALIGFLTAGDPDIGATAEHLNTLIESGADVVELGIPFSDPLLDGPVIQASAQHALDAGTKVSEIFDLVREVRKTTQVPLILMTCLNPIHRRGISAFARECSDAGVDGVLITDMPPAEGAEWIRAARSCSLDRIFMLAPTSSAERIRNVSAVASGFIYCQSRAGVTGERNQLPPDLPELVRLVRGSSDVPVAVGFGISTPEHVKAVSATADGAIVGTAIVRMIGEHRTREELGAFVRSLKAATRAA